MLFCVEPFYKTSLSVTVKYVLTSISIQHIMLNAVTLIVATLNVMEPQ
jgi:hypothetical protein